MVDLADCILRNIYKETTFLRTSLTHIPDVLFVTLKKTTLMTDGPSKSPDRHRRQLRINCVEA